MQYKPSNLKNPKTDFQKMQDIMKTVQEVKKIYEPAKKAYEEAVKPYRSLQKIRKGLLG